MKVRRGDVVLVDYLYSDRTGSKIRPCLVVQNDRNNGRLDDTIIAMITTRQRFTSAPTQLLVNIATPDGALTGLLFDSAVACENLLTIDGKFIRRKMGQFSPSLMEQVDSCLKVSLAIS
jgi:mRNA interferase MazF